MHLQRNSGRRRSGCFLVEGPNLVTAAAGRELITEIFATETAAARYPELLADAPWHLITERAAQALSETVTPTGLVAVCRMPTVTFETVSVNDAALVVVAVDIAEPGNAGTLIRLADAMGAAAVILTGHSVDPYNGKCLRSSAGSIFGVPVLTEPDSADILARLRAGGAQLLATTVDGELSLDDADEVLSRRTVWIFGSESHGLSPDITKLADYRVAIPLVGSVQSVNVATAAAICLYQSAKAQRNKPKQ